MKMDWEELKMSIKKSTARKGRRSKSRDPVNIKNSHASPTSNGTSMATSSNAYKEISIDITLDMQSGCSTSTVASETKRPPMLRRISGGWADSGVFKSSKSKKGIAEDERFHISNVPKSASAGIIDDITIIPDLDDNKDEVLLNEIAEPKTKSMHRVPFLTDSESDLLTQKAFTRIQGVDLSILTGCLLPQNTLDEGDTVWEWDKLFTEVVGELNSEKRGCNIDIRPNTSVDSKLHLGPDELPPPLHI